MSIHQSILEENGTAFNAAGGLVSGAAGDGETLLFHPEQEDEEMARVASNYASTADDGVLSPERLSLTNFVPVRTGKRGRPPGSTTGAAAKRMAQQAEQVVLLSRAVYELQKQLREVREALATVVETQSNQSAVLAVLQQQLAAEKTANNLHPMNGASSGDERNVEDAYRRSMLA